jgi:hypothetical protein
MRVLFLLQMLLGIFFAPLNIYQITLEMRAERQVDLYVKCRLTFPDFDRDCNMPASFTEAL